MGGGTGEESGVLESSGCLILRAKAMEEPERWVGLGTEA